MVMTIMVALENVEADYKTCLNQCVDKCPVPIPMGCIVNCDKICGGGSVRDANSRNGISTKMS